MLADPGVVAPAVEGVAVGQELGVALGVGEEVFRGVGLGEEGGGHVVVVEGDDHAGGLVGAAGEAVGGCRSSLAGRKCEVENGKDHHCQRG